jgi:antitoxin CptB
MNGEETVPLSKLRWRCRRGMRELDVVLVRYLEHSYPDAGAARRLAFQQLLELPDPDLFDLLRGRTQASTPDMEAIVAELRRPN